MCKFINMVYIYTYMDKHILIHVTITTRYMNLCTHMSGCLYIYIYVYVCMHTYSFVINCLHIYIEYADNLYMYILLYSPSI